MSYISKEEIMSMVKKGDRKNSHVLICLDHFDYKYFPKYISYDENVNNVILDVKNGRSSGMFSVEEIYNYSLDIDDQLNEDRAYHIEPLNIINNTNPKVIEALDYATKMHEGQFRKDGTPYIEHPIRVANYVLKYKKSHNIDELVASAYLHDTLEDTNASYYDIVKLFGAQVASIVLELTTDKDLKNEIGKEKYLAIKMKNMTNWALVIKLCERLDNISDLESQEQSFRNRYIEETLQILDYVVNNRELSGTMINIINQILKRLFILNPLDDDKNMKITNIFQKLKDIKIFENEQSDNLVNLQLVL